MVHKLDTSIGCSNCNIPLCEECKKIENEKILCSRCYIRSSITVKPKKKEEPVRSFVTRKLPEVDPERIKLLIKNTKERQLVEEEKKKEEDKEKLPELKQKEMKNFCNWHDKRIAEYICTKCRKTFCRDCLGEKKLKEIYCKSCWSSIKYSHLLNKPKK
jgi:hypothetical protein